MQNAVPCWVAVMLIFEAAMMVAILGFVIWADVVEPRKHRKRRRSHTRGE